LNILLDDLPDAVEIDGQDYQIETDYRDAIRVILAFEDDELTTSEKQAVLLSLYKEPVGDVAKASRQAVKFLNGGETSEGDDNSHPYRLYSFSKDANYIFAAFRQTHGIDLQRENLHWWQFIALFMDLGSDTAFCNLISLREKVKSGRANKEERAAARRMGDAFDVPEPDTRTISEKEAEAEFMRLLGMRKR
jgi:hypothetical protein